MTNRGNMRFLNMIILLCIVMMSIQVSAWGDDDDKKNQNRKRITKVTFAIDSSKALHLDKLGRLISVEDTLVFDDWENPENGRDSEYNDTDSDAPREYGLSVKQDRILYNKHRINEAMIIKNSQTRNEVSFSIYPNPVQRTLHINTEATPIMVRIADIQGREHYINSFSTQVDIYDLPTGNYFLQLMYEDHIETRRFVKK